VDTPSSTVQTKLPDSDLATIVVGKKKVKKKVFFGVKGKEVRKAALGYMAQKYKMEFTDAELDQFALIDEFGVPMEGLKQLIAMKTLIETEQVCNLVFLAIQSTIN
jgi:hypothetical protein